MKIKIFYIGEHQPQEILEVEEKIAGELVNSGKFVYVGELKSEEKPNESWTEKRIAEYIKKHNIPIKYHLTNDEKVDILEKLKKYGHC